MTPHRRLFKAVNKEPVDRVPLICPGGMMTMAVVEAMELLKAPWPQVHEDAKLMADLTEGMARLSGIENLGVPFCMTIEAEEMGATVDLGNLTREPHVTRFAMETMAEMDLLAPLDPEKGRAAVCCEAIGLLKERRPDLPILGNLSGPVSLATSLVDPLLYYRAIRREKQLVHDLTDFCTDQAILFGEAMVQAGADMICIADPSATGDLLGPAAFEEFVMPQLNRMTRRFQEELAVPVIVHICGKVKGTGELLQSLAAKVVSVDSVVGLSRLAEMAPDKVTMGNVSTFTLERGTPDKVAKAGLSCIRQGVGILAPACGISPLTPLANIRSLSQILTVTPEPASKPFQTNDEESDRAKDNL